MPRSTVRGEIVDRRVYYPPTGEIHQSTVRTQRRHDYRSPVRDDTGMPRSGKALGALSGAALAVGAKEAWDRRDSDAHYQRTGGALSTAAISAAGALAGYKMGEMYAKHRDSDARVDYARRDDRVVARTHRSRSVPRQTTWRDDRKIQHAARAALLAGATEAMRVRKEPGGWTGPKGRRILAASVGAGAIDAAAENKTRRHSKRHALEAIAGGLAFDRIINGSRKEDERRWRSKSRSKSRTRWVSDNDSYYSSDSFDSRSPSPSYRGRHKRSKSLSDYARKGLANIGVR